MSQAAIQYQGLLLEDRCLLSKMHVDMQLGWKAAQNCRNSSADRQFTILHKIGLKSQPVPNPYKPSSAYELHSGACKKQRERRCNANVFAG
jgi:hypothetical protein